MPTTQTPASTCDSISGQSLWQRYCQYYFGDSGLGFSLDISRVRFDDDYLDGMSTPMQQAIEAMAALEAGGIANADEGRMVGHYWLRDPELAPSSDISDEIRQSLHDIRDFAAQVHDGSIAGAGGTGGTGGTGGSFQHVLHVGIGGSALGPQFVGQALATGNDHIQLHYIDNTDPDGIDQIVQRLGDQLDRTLVTIVSKSGGTPEPRNGMIEIEAAYQRAGLSFAQHAIAVTMPDSKLDQTAQQAGWLRRFAIWDWVGGRTSVMSAVGLVPLALQGVDIDAFLQGAADMDRLTRAADPRQNPAALLALMWHKLGHARGEKDMVVLPYKDRLMMFSRYLQQLVMESLGKELDRRGNTVHQGIAVYGNKGSTDQHAYVQQLRDGVPNFFATFIQVLHDRDGASVPVEPGTTSGDYLLGFLQGTRRALYENGRDSITLTIDQVSPASVGALIALFERAVGLYAELIDINAYHQPGVEAGKKAAAAVLGLQNSVLSHLASSGVGQTAEQIAAAIGQPDEAETVYKVLEHRAANADGGIVMRRGNTPDQTTFAAR